MATVGDSCSHDVVTVAESDPLPFVAARMLGEHVRCVIVARNDDGKRRAVGVISERDLVSALARVDRSASTAVAAEIMSTPMASAKAGEPLEDALGRMSGYGVRNLPVLGDAEELVGLINFDDFVGLLAQRIHQLARIVSLEAGFDAKRQRSAPALPDATKGVSLLDFARGRLVMLDPYVPLYDAIRALEDNHVGAVIAHDGDRLVGIATDRDIALRGGSFGLDATKSTLADVMSKDVATLEVTDGVLAAIELMRHRHVRRVPLTQGQRVVGIVTLDDLVVSGRIGLHQLAEIVRAQLTEPSRLKPSGVVHPGTSGSRART